MKCYNLGRIPSHTPSIGISILAANLVFFIIIVSSRPSETRAQSNSDSSNPLSLDEIFAQRTGDDWRQVWHTERHRRCYHELQPHMNIACEKDIYRIQKKNGRHIPDIFRTALLRFPRATRIMDSSSEDGDGLSAGEKGLVGGHSYLPLPDGVPKDDISVFLLSPKRANEFFRHLVPEYRSSDPVKRQISAKRRGIIEECCQGPTGCTWEEYAEYCSTHIRVRS